MIKKEINQKDKLDKILINTIETKFNFSNKSINRFNSLEKNKDSKVENKIKLLEKLKDQINSIENCSLKNNSKNLIIGEGNIDSQIMIIGESPGVEEEKFENIFQGVVGNLLDKMLIAIGIKRKNIYCTYAVNFRPPEDRKPTSQEIRRYSIFLKDHISIINPKIVVLMGSSAMEAVTGINGKISSERGNWKEVILKNITYSVMITYNPSYLIRFPENKKFSWEDLKKIRQKIKDLNLKV
tara:strand:+ start:825 stop:1544 length:720 start_codon:yes stop_codon:yes gene_type:complete